jgi:hypothetical protein
VALPRIGFNEGSLLRRTLLHVGTFVLGSVAFISFVSFMLVSIAKGLVSPRAAVADEEVSAVTTVASGISRPLSAPLGKPGSTRGALRRGANVPTTAPSKDD